MYVLSFFFFFFQAEDGIRDYKVTGVQTCALPIYVALLRADLVTMAPVDVVAAVGAALETLVEKIESFGGRVEEVSPGGVVAVVGLEPIEDAPRRAAHAALAIPKIAAHARRGSPGSPR